MYKMVDEVTKLLNKRGGGLRASLYIPTHPASNSASIAADRIRLKNAIKHIRHHEAYNEPELHKSLVTLEKLYDDIDFWKHQELGLAIFLSKNDITYIKLPFEVSEAVYLTDHFVVSPLVIMNAVDTSYYVLDLNFTTPRLFRGAHGKLTQVNQANMPGALDNEVGKDEYKKHLQHHSGTDNAFHGHSPEDIVDDEIRKYLKLLAGAVDTYLLDKHSPLLLAGTPNRVGNLLKQLRYKNILAEHCEGSAERLNAAELYNVSTHIIQNHFAERTREAVARLNSAAPQYVLQGASEITQVASSDMGIRIESLYLPIYRLTKDSVRPGDNTSIAIELPDNISATEALVTSVISQGGAIIPVEIDAHGFKKKPKALQRY